MSAFVNIRDALNGKLSAHVHKLFGGRSEHNGLLVQTERFLQFNPEFHPFLNDTFGAAMNQNVTFGTAAATLHDGGTSAAGDTGTADTNTPFHVIQSGKTFTSTTVVGSIVQVASNFATVTNVTDTDLTCDVDIAPDGNEAYTIDPVWVGSAVAGTWDFAATGKVTLTSGVNGDEAAFDGDSSASLDMTNFTAFTGKVDLDTYNPTNNDITIAFNLAGVLVGNSVNINPFIDTGSLAEQNFVIPKADLGLTTQSVDGFSIVFSRTGGPQGAFKLDDLQLEGSGDPAIFKATTPTGSKFHVTEIRIAISDNIASTLTNGTLLGLDHSTLLGVSALANGLIFSRVQKGETLFSVRLTSLGSFMSTGSNIVNATALNTKTFITLLVEFPEPIVLEGGEDDFLSFTVNDDLSGLTQFTAAARGAVEIPIST